jgi:hypothetical protein
MIEVLRRTVATLSIVFSPGYADSDVLVTVRDQIPGSTPILLDELAVLDPNEPGRYTVDLPPQPTVNLLSVTWAGAFGGVDQALTYDVEVVGEVLFTVSELRNFGDRALADEATYPDEDLISTRSRITEDFAKYCGVSFVPRYGLATLDGSGRNTAWLPNIRTTAVLHGSANGTPLSEGELADVFVYPTGKIEKIGRWNCGNRNLVIGYQHGYEEPPAAISRAGLILARYEMVRTDVAERMVTFANELGTIRLSVPGPGQHTGIPIVDETLVTYSARTLAGADI